MRRTPALVCLTAALAGGGLIAAQSGEADSTQTQYVVLYEAGASPAAAAQAVEAAGGTLVSVNRDVGVATATATTSDFQSKAAASDLIQGVAHDTSIGHLPSASRAKEDAIEHDAAEASAPTPATKGADKAEGDPLSSVQWDMRAIGASTDGSYAVNPGSHDVRVGIIDTGIDGNHPDIRDNFNRDLSRNFTTDVPSIDGACDTDPDKSCSDPSDVDEDGHGTHVASTIGSPLNGVGMAGVAPGVELVNLRAGQDSGYFFLQPTVDALTYAGDNGIDVVNMSFYIDPWLFNCPGAPEDSPAERMDQKTIIAATERALAYARDRGVTLVSAEGNGNSDLDEVTSDDTSPDFPVDANGDPSMAHVRTVDGTCVSEPTGGKDVIGVTSVGPSGRKAYYSDYGTSQADVAAPGGDSREYFQTPAYRVPENTIIAAFPEQLGRTTDTNLDGKLDIDANGLPTAPSFVRSCVLGKCGYYQYIQGTSMASPHAAGVAALIVAARGVPDPKHGGKTLSPAVVEQVLGETATDKPCPDPATFTYPFDRAGTYTATCEGTAAKNSFFGEGLVNALAAATPPGSAGPPKTIPTPPAGTTTTDPATPPAAAPAPAPAADAGTAPATTTSGPLTIPGTTKASSRLAHRFKVGRTTRVTRLSVTGAPGAQVLVTCKGRGCPAAKQVFVIGRVGAVNVAKAFRGVKLTPGTRVRFLVTGAGQTTKRFSIVIRKGKAPRVRG